MESVKRFLSIGECMVELSPASDDLLKKSFAGDTFNTAWYARKLLGADWTVSYFSAVGDDALSSDMLQFMAAARIDVSHITRIPACSPGLYMIHLMNGERSFSYWRSASAARQLARDESKLQTACLSANIVYVSGISFAILESRDRIALLAALAAAKNEGAVIAYDPNFRRRLWHDNEEARGVNAQAAKLADVILTGRDDESALNGVSEPEKIIQFYRQRGAEHVVVKDGGGPVSILKDGAIVEIPVPAVKTVVDTTAAGDSFNACYLARWMVDADVRRAAEEASGVAGQVIGGAGALVEIVN